MEAVGTLQMEDSWVRGGYGCYFLACCGVYMAASVVDVMGRSVEISPQPTSSTMVKTSPRGIESFFIDASFLQTAS